MPEKIIIPLLLIIGAAAIAYGMMCENNFVFIIGIIIVAGGYLLIRKNLKRSTKNKQKMESSNTLDK